MTAGHPRSRSLPRTPPRHRALGGTLLGVFIGIVVGLGMAASVAYWLMKNNPALPMPTLSHGDAQDAARDAGKVARTDDKPRFDFYKILPGVEEPKVQPRAERGDRAVVEQAKDRSQNGAASPATTVDAAQAKPASLDAARPLATDAGKAAMIDAGKAPADARAAKASDRFWLQAGSFSTAPDAENLRARLALAGWEATVQPGALPDKSVRYRVRIGPYDNADELTRMKSELAKRGFDVAVIHY